jgi:RimJ/RimL family protein N-acetyltransferase
MDLQSAPLVGRFVRLAPITPELKEPMRAVLDRDPEAWLLLSSTSQGGAFDAAWDRNLEAQAQGAMLTFAIERRSDGCIVGRSSYLNIRPEDGGVEIGATFLHPDVRGGPVNPEAKLLMLAHAFASGAIRVELVTDARNLRSQAAIAKLGAVREGVLRHRNITWTGHRRDTVVFSILEAEWPALRERLERRLAAFAPGAPP